MLKLKNTFFLKKKTYKKKKKDVNNYKGNLVHTLIKINFFFENIKDNLYNHIHVFFIIKTKIRERKMGISYRWEGIMKDYI